MKKDDLIKIAIPLEFKIYEIKTLLNGRKVIKQEFIKYKNTKVIGVPKYSLELGEPYDFQIVEKVAEGNMTTCVQIEPKFKVGDICYIKESCFNIKRNDDKYYYRADVTPEIERCRKENNIIWRPAVHMPQNAARLFVCVSKQYAKEIKKPVRAWKWFYEFERIIPEDINL